MRLRFGAEGLWFRVLGDRVAKARNLKRKTCSLGGFTKRVF